MQILHQGRIVFSSSVAELDTTREDQSLRVALRRPPPGDALRNLAGVRRLEDLGQGKFRLFHRTQNATGPIPCSGLRPSRIGALYELVPETRSLEELFVELTFGEDAGEVAPETGEPASP